MDWNATCEPFLRGQRRDTASPPKENTSMDSHQMDRLEKHRKLPAEGEFLAGADTYDENGHPLPTGTVPLADPRQRPAEGDIVDDIDEQRHATSSGPAPA